MAVKRPKTLQLGQCSLSIGTEDKPGWESHDGKIESNGAARISRDFTTTDPKYSAGHPPPGTRRRWEAIGKFEGSRGNAQVLLRGQDCNFEFVRYAESLPEQERTDLRENDPNARATKFDGTWKVAGFANQFCGVKSPEFLIAVTRGEISGVEAGGVDSGGHFHFTRASIFRPSVGRR
jgi:hypothetical protein